MNFLLPKPEGEEQKGELYKHRLTLRALLLDKLILAFFFLVLGYVVNRSLEAYKSGLQKDLEQFKFEQGNLAALTRAQQEQSLARQQQSYARELANLRAQQDKQFETLHSEQERNLDALRIMLGTQSQLAARRVVAYGNVWKAYGILYNRVENLDVRLDGFPDVLRPEDASSLKAAIATFEETFGAERIFLDPELSNLLEVISINLSIAAQSKIGGKSQVKKLFETMVGVERMYRSTMEDALGKSPRLPSH